MRSLLYALTVLSLPMRGAWIEIDVYNYDRVVLPGRSPCGERGLKSCGKCIGCRLAHVAPHAGSVD